MRPILTVLLSLLLAVSALLAAPAPARAFQDGWQPASPGIDYQAFYTAGPNHVYVTRMDRANPRVTLESGIANGILYSGTQTVSDIAGRYDDSLSFWGGRWGARMRVVAAINGSFFNTGSSVPVGGIVTGGWYARRFEDLGGGSGFAWGVKGSAMMGQCVLHKPERQTVVFEGSGKILTLDGLNQPREEGKLVLYTPQYGPDTGQSGGVEVVVEMLRPAMLLPPPHGATGFVREVRDGQPPAALGFDQVVLSASGTARDALLAAALPNDTVVISQEVTHFQKDCETPNPQEWTNTYTSLGGAFNFLADGEIIPDNDETQPRHPRTAVAYNDQYVFFIVVDGRRPGFSIGMTMQELAEFARFQLGAAWGMAQDGGGSSTMLLNGVVMNKPVSVCNATYLPFVTGGEAAQPGPPLEFQRESVEGIYQCERPVANVFMMVALEPELRSNAFAIGDQINAPGGVKIRLGPGSNYPALAALPEGSSGVIIPHSNNLEGVYARGTYWWKVAFGDVVGWAPQEQLVFVSAAPPNVGE